MSEVYIIDGARTAFGEFGQSFLKVSATELGKATAIEALKRSNVEVNEIQHVIYGNVIQSSTNAAYLARHIALKASVPFEVPALTLNRLCGSGLQAVISGAQSIRLKEANIVLAGGAENMSQSPHSDFVSRFGGIKLGNHSLEDMLMNTLIDQQIGCEMGMTAEHLATQYEISREQQDEYAALSHQRAGNASKKLAEEIVDVTVKTKQGMEVINKDKHVKPHTTFSGLASLKPVFKKGGTVTAGNSSGINDGAVSLVIAGKEYLSSRKPLAKIVSWGISGVNPRMMGIGPVPASLMALKRAQLTIQDIDLVEINEAFAVQYLAVEKELKLDRRITNVNGGAIALGHPVGASGARILLSLAYELRRRNKRYGLASLCIGGGQGIAMIIENVN